MIYPIKEWEKLKRGYKFGQKTFYSNFHLGLDIIAPIGEPIFAWQTLKIISAYFGKEGGNTALIKCPNNDRLFRIMHLNKPAAVGNYEEGKQIAEVGNTGKMSTGSHLHIDISKDGSLDIYDTGNFEDPEIYFKTTVNPTKKVSIPPYAIKVKDPAQLKELDEKYLIRDGKDIYSIIKKISNPEELKGLKESQLVRIGESIYKKLP